METTSATNHEKTRSNLFENVKVRLMETAKNTKKIGEDDPRRIFHSVKVGFTLTLVSLFYYFRPLYNGFGQAGMWAILTVVVVFEFSVGGTISKSLNRGGATLLAGALGVGAEYLANLCGERGEPIVLGLLVFILAAVSTFTRFIPNVKRRYDYGVLIFILTFSLVAVSGARISEIMELAHQRLSTILIGGATCIVVSLCIYPVWAGQDLHHLIASNIQNLSASLQGFGNEFGDVVSSKDGRDKSYHQIHKSVLNSKATEESLANFAWWEPSHGRFKFNHPWKLYLNVGSIVRQCACQIETLSGCTINSKPQKIQPSCVKMSMECGKALKELSTAIKSMWIPSSAVAVHLNNSKAAADELKNIMENYSSLPSEADGLQEIVPILVVASILIDIIKFVEKIAVSVNELSQEAGFKQPQLLHRGIVKPINDDDQVVVEIVDTPERKKPLRN
ncbi:aluminum-activated malate transporter 8-like isoform X2 [Salvia miltiorrhiza]|uniref:aluminum-activated malate transporter 8-like isoform X2 n=1 Tax=Salvia miltiorrhiza TaxID=226208 RepID=UPI0025AC8E4C|nr:aluminum-activated malate transporter 8-like isoform X2 [Salvia miltiorrhiza]